MAERSRNISLLMTAALGGLFLTGYQPRPLPEPPRSDDDPAVVLIDSRGERAAGFAAFDSAFASFTGLIPNARHTIELVRSDGRLISRTALVADGRGVIPTTAIWWDVGVVYPPGSRVGRFDEQAVSGDEYSLRLLRDERPIRQWPFPILEPRPVIYTSDAEGNPMNGFLFRRDDVYVTGRYLKPGRSYAVHIVPDRHDWRVGDRIDSLLPEPIVIHLEPHQREFTRFILPWRPATVGAYDVVLEAWPRDGILDRNDLVDSFYGVGFTVVLPLTPPPPHIATELACQAPPHDPATGAVRDALNPIYKDVFAPIEEVWVAVNPWAGGESHAGMAARLYVVDHRTGAEWSDGEPLADISDDGYEEVTIQPGCASVNYTRVWTAPAIREDGYDVVVDFEPFGVYDRGQDFLDHLDDKGFGVPARWIALDSLTFNHDDASTASDAISLRKNLTEAVVVPEWQRDLESHPAAYVADRTVTVEAHFSAGPGVTSAKLRAAVAGGALGALGSTTVSFPTSGPVSFRVTGSTPEAIERFYQQWLWYVEDINGSGSNEVMIAGTRNRIYTVLAPPRDPWTTSGQTRPWTEALDRAAVWAAGETTLAGAAGRVARHLLGDTGGLHVYGSSYTSAGPGIFHLTNFLTAIPFVGEVNCHDMGRSVTVFANLLGAGLDYRTSRPFGSLHCEKAIGRDWNCDEAFGNHGFGSMDGRVFDACLRIDDDDDPHAFPHAEAWMLDVPWNRYKFALVEDPGEPGDPRTHSVEIDVAGHGGEALEQQVERLKALYDFLRWPEETGEVISGIALSTAVVPQFEAMEPTWPQAFYTLDHLGDREFVAIRQRWESPRGEVDVTMVVAPTLSAAKEYLIFRYANTQREKPLVMPRSSELGWDLGHLALVLPEGGSDGFARIDFLRHNVLFMLRAEGGMRGELRAVADAIDRELRAKESATSLEGLPERPLLRTFRPERAKIRSGQKVALVLDVESPGNRPLRTFWMMDSGGVEENLVGQFLYYGEASGAQTITVTAVNDLGLRVSATTKLTVTKP